MAAQDEREPGGLVMCNVLDPMAQDIPEQDIVMGELELPPQMDPKPEMSAAAAAEAAVYDTSPSPPHQNPPPILAESAQPSMFDMILQAINEMNGNAQRMESKMGSMNEKMEANSKEM